MHSVHGHTLKCTHGYYTFILCSCGSCASQLAHIFSALFSRFLCPWRAPESQQTHCSTAQLERILLQGRHLGPRLGTQSSLFPLLGGSSAWRWQVSPAWILFCKQVLSRYFLPYPNRFLCGSILASFISGAPLGNFNLGLTGYLWVLISWVKDSTDCSKLPSQIHCLKLLIPL